MNTICMPSYVWMIMLAFVVYQMYNIHNMRSMSMQQPQQIIVQQPQQQDVVEHIKYPRMETDPLIPPGRPGGEYMPGGSASQFEKWGFLTGPDGNTRVPLYGRRLGSGGDEYEYYVVMQGNNKVMLPNKREIYSDDVISTIPTVDDMGDWKAYIYKPFPFAYDAMWR